MTTGGRPQLRVRISADLDDIKQGLGLLRGELAKVRAAAEGATPNPAAGNFGAGIQALRGQIVALAGAYVGLSAAAAGVRSFFDAVDRADKLNDVSQQVNIGVEALSKYGFAAQMSGSDQETLNKGLVSFNKNLRENSPLLKQLGVDTSSTESALLGVADVFQKLPEGAARTELATKLFGKAGAELIPMLTEGREGLARFGAEAEKLGVVVTPQAAAAAAEFNDNMDRLRASSQGLALRVAEQLLPTLTLLSERLLQNAKDVGILKGAFITFFEQVFGGTGLSDVAKKELESVEKGIRSLQEEINDRALAGDSKRVAVLQAELAKLEARAEAARQKVKFAADLEASAKPAATPKPEPDKKLQTQVRGLLGAGKPDDTFGQQRLALARQLAQATNELSNALNGEASSQNAASSALEAWLADAENAKKLTSDQVAELRRLAVQVDETKAATVRFAEEERRAAEDREETRRGFEEARKDYEALRAELATPTEAAVDKATAQIERLQKAIRAAQAQGDEPGQLIDRIVRTSFTAAPNVGQRDPEQAAFDEQLLGLQSWYDQQLALAATFRKAKIIGEEEYSARLLSIEEQRLEALRTLEERQLEMRLTAAAAGAESLAQIGKALFGEQSKEYRTLFALSKGFAAAQLAVSLATNVAKASEIGFPANIATISAALAQGAQIASILAGARYAEGGRIVGPGTGTSDSVPLWGSNGEFMLREAVVSQPGMLPFLEDLNDRGWAALEPLRFATGGLISQDVTAAMAAGEARLAASSAPGAGGGGARPLRNIIVFDEAELAAALEGSAGEDVIVNHVRRNRGAIDV